MLDTDLLGVGIAVGGPIQVPSFVIVDPDTADPLAIIEVVEDIDAESLTQVATRAGAYASRLAGKSVQGYVIRVNVNGISEDQQVQFYRIWPNSTLHQLSSRNFPDLDALKVARKLMLNSVAQTQESSSVVDYPNGSGVLTRFGAGHDDHENNGKAKSRGPGAGLYIPALALLLLFLLDLAFLTSQGTALLSITHSLLAFGAALLFSLPAAINYLRR